MKELKRFTKIQMYQHEKIIIFNHHSQLIANGRFLTWRNTTNLLQQQLV